MTAPRWMPVTVTLSRLQAWTENPRLSTKAQARRILASFADFGQVETIAIGPPNDDGLQPLYNGHQRLNALYTLHGPSCTVDARQSDRPLTDDERRRLVVALHAGAVGEWNWDALSGWPADLLTGGGFDADLLAEWNRDAGNLRTMLQANGEPLDMAEAWQGMPEFEQEDASAFKTIIVHFSNEEGVRSFAELVKQTITSNTRFVWYPPKERANLLALVAHEQS